MLRFTEQQMALLRELAAPLAPSQRPAFLQEVARRLHGIELGDGAVAQAAREAQVEIRVTMAAGVSVAASTWSQMRWPVRIWIWIWVRKNEPCRKR